MRGDGHPKEQLGAKLRVFSIPGAGSTTQYVALLCAALKRTGVILLPARSWRVLALRIDVVHIHFAGNFIVERGLLYGVVRAAATLSFLAAVKVLGRKRVVYTVHDVVPMAIRNERLLWPYLRALNRLIDGHMFLSDSSQEHFYRVFPRERGKPFVRIDHSSFPVRRMDGDARGRFRATFAGDQDNDFLVGFLGSIKTYKGLDALPSLPMQLRNGRRVRAVVVGPIEAAYTLEAARALGAVPGGVIRIDRFLSDDDLERFIQSVDAVILPYTGGWNSGMVMLVLSLHRPLLLSDRPIFVEMERAVGSPWIYVFDNDPGRRSASLDDRLNALDEATVLKAEEARLARFIADRHFDQAAIDLCAFYRRLLRR